MAINKNKKKINFFTGFSGKIGNDFVIKQYKGRTIVTKYPDMSKVVPSKKQKKSQAKFAKAVAFAREVINTPALKEQWLLKTPDGMTVYNAALKWYMQNME
jgi:hypothetical protein